MKLSTLALAGLVATTNAASCRRWGDNISYVYEAGADGVGDIGGICNGLWDNLKAFSSCLVLYNTSCGQGSNGAGHLHWHFEVGMGCDAGSVEAAWFEATNNDYGSINCG
ncbi:hypothetical protein FQN54_005744 [Arachnomyces sp. PD_36]|nr:hypothetical protein FQN54_005744 [Arachnomyces sp. PD_36]